MYVPLYHNVRVLYDYDHRFIPTVFVQI
jgi:hypothetical protein